MVKTDVHCYVEVPPNTSWNVYVDVGSAALEKNTRKWI